MLVTCHLAALALLALVSMLVRPSLLACASGGYVAGAAVADMSALPDLLAIFPNRPNRDIVRMVKSWLREPRTGVGQLRFDRLAGRALPIRTARISNAGRFRNGGRPARVGAHHAR